MSKINPNFSARPACAGWFCRIMIIDKKINEVNCQPFYDEELSRIEVENGVIYYGPLPISSLDEGMSVAEKLACVLSGKDDVENGE